MRIPHEVLKCVVFVFAKTPNGDDVEMGTAFFIGYPLHDEPPQTELGAVYAVTAGHVIDSVKRLGNGKCYFRMNNREHGAQLREVPLDRWVQPDDIRIDVAALRVDFDVFNQYDHDFIPKDMFISGEFLRNVAPGRQLFFPGLFMPHKGERSNIPVMRTGSIAAMPIERVATATHGNIRAYLAEARSIGGLSGSPVFVYLEEYMGPISLLGLIQGHFDEKYAIVCGADEKTGDDIAVERQTAKEARINMGIALVIPLDDLETVLNSPQFVQERKLLSREARERQSQMFPTDD
jgi:hypothetical protein